MYLPFLILVNKVKILSSLVFLKFVITYNTKKISYFTSAKDKIPELSHNNVVDQVIC